MSTALLGRKVGMTQIFREDGTCIPVTVLSVGPCEVVQVKKADGPDGYSAVQLGYEKAKPKNVTKPLTGHFQKAGVAPKKVLREFRTEVNDARGVGDKVTVGIFGDVKFVDVIGTSKGRGFAGTVKRYGFSIGGKGHGSMKGRRPGSIGMHTWPGRVWKGKRMGGHFGAARITAKNLKVVEVNEEHDMLLVSGSVPGPNGGLVVVQKAKTAKVK
ncbi:MAG: 50S ribosomal protein L3 [Planctomycetes bacterium]|nr:50S ribosomal protein L3 [Planctomycetota bacterium]